MYLNRPPSRQAVYVFKLMQRPFDTSKPEDRDLRARFNYLVCWDPWTALYIAIATFSLVWLVLGSVWLGRSADCKSDTRSVATFVLALSWVHLIAGFFVFWCSWFRDCFATAATQVNASLGRQFEYFREMDRRAPAMGYGHAPSEVVAGTPAATCAPETDAQLAARLQRDEETARDRHPPAPTQYAQQYQPQQPPGNLEKAARGALWGAKLGAKLAGAAVSAAAREAQRQRQAHQEAETQRRVQEQQSSTVAPPQFRTY